MVSRGLSDRDRAGRRSRSRGRGGAAGEGAGRALLDGEVIGLGINRVEVVGILDKVDTVARACDPTATGRVHSDRALAGLNRRIENLRVRRVRVLMKAGAV